ncbi:MAG TPA: hypothetical protein VFS95_04995 [Telluria sp.]|nr:hypothetical protein [Telluria sp.]
MRLHNAAAVLDCVRAHGVVLESAKGPAPRLIDAIAGEPVQGRWWAHAQGKRIFALLDAVKDADDILVCRLIDGKVTLVHRRLWPQLVCVAARLKPEQLAKVEQQHTASGRHVSVATPFPQWVPPAALAEAEAIDIDAAWTIFSPYAGAV